MSDILEDASTVNSKRSLIYKVELHEYLSDVISSTSWLLT